MKTGYQTRLFMRDRAAWDEDSLKKPAYREFQVTATSPSTLLDICDYRHKVTPFECGALKYVKYPLDFRTDEERYFEEAMRRNAVCFDDQANKWDVMTKRLVAVMAVWARKNLMSRLKKIYVALPCENDFGFGVVNKWDVLKVYGVEIHDQYHSDNYSKYNEAKGHWPDGKDNLVIGVTENDQAFFGAF